VVQRIPAGRSGTTARGVRRCVATAGLAVAVAACAPPGAKLQDRTSKGGQKAAQLVAATPKDMQRCHVQPPHIQLRGAKVGFAQVENNNPFRIAETASLKAAAKRRGVDLLVTDAQSNTPKQVADMQDMVAQGVDFIIVPPREELGLTPALETARKAHVPVIFADRAATATPCRDFLTFIGSDFVEQGRRAARWLVKATHGKAKVAELIGTVGATATNDRGEGFESVIAKHKGMKIVAQQSGDFARAPGQNVMEQILGANPDITAVYAQNDEMALGAIQALKDAGLKPGKDVQVVSVDGSRDALEAIVHGDLGATVETNPRFGPLAFDTIQRFLDGKPIPVKVIVKDRLFDRSNAREFVQYAY
jgi:ribose transport system substrate-binding protein